MTNVGLIVLVLSLILTRGFEIQLLLATMKRTALFEAHKALGAKMITFAGFEMPVEYSGITREHMAVRQAVGLFDISHMGVFKVAGLGSIEYLQMVTSNDITRLEAGKIQYSSLLNEHGGIIDDLLVYCTGTKEYLLVVNAANIQKDWEWCKLHKSKDVILENLSGTISIISLQGPKANLVLQKITGLDTGNIRNFTFRIDTVAGIENVLISNTGYTGAGGFELLVPSSNAVIVWNALMETGRTEGLLPAGLGARDTLRLEMGYCLHGNDINETTSPLMAGLTWITKLKGNSPFIGRVALENQKKIGIEKLLTGLIMEEKGIPRSGYKLFDLKGEEIGVVTSGTISPLLQKGIGLGYLVANQHEDGTEIFVSIRERLIKARVKRPPFI